MRGVGGVKEAAVDVVNMELVLTPEGGKLDVDRLLEAIRAACGHGRK